MLSVDSKYFIDAQGRQIMLRGVNTPAKLPSKLETFYDGKNVSFVGKPWPLDVAEEHAKNLKRLGFNMVRLIITWEAVMHDGPDQFDEDYLTYLGKLVSILERHEIFVDIDPHQDVFSRFSGGDGAPEWTFQHAGLIPETFYDTIAATTDYEYRKHQEAPIPFLMWQTNLAKLACQTMFTLFFAGDTYAPKTELQHLFQDQYLKYIEKITEVVKGNKNILCVATMNELSNGYIGNTKLNQVVSVVKMGLMPTSLEGFALADGRAMQIERYVFTKIGFFKRGKELINEKRVRSWNGECIWKEHGVWDYDDQGEPVIKKPNHFAIASKESFADAFYKPFARELYNRVRKVRSGTRILLQTQEFIEPPHWDLEKDGSDVIWGHHWYDPVMTAFRWYQNIFNVYEMTQRVVFFRFFIFRAIRREMARILRSVKKYIGDVPYLMGETGFVMDLNWGLLGIKGPATKDNDYTYVAKGAERTMQGLEANLINACIWNYNIHNTLKNGDDWNSENFSIYCKDLVDPIRAKEGWQRPFPQRIPGRVKHLTYCPRTRVFHTNFKADLNIKAPCEIYLPDFLIEEIPPKVTSSKGEIKIDGQILKFTPESTHAWVKIHFG